MAVPADLQRYFCCKEIYRSLQTASIKDAADTAQVLSIAVRDVFKELRQKIMSGEHDSSLTSNLTLDDVIKHAKEKIYLRSRIDELELVLEAASDVQRAEKKRHAEMLALVVRESTRELKKPSPLFSRLVDDYRRDRLAQKKWTPKTEAENLAVYKLFIDIIGDLPLAEIGEDQALTYFETLQRLPANMNKVPAYRGKSISEILALEPPPMAIRSVNKNVERISSLFKFAISKPKYDLRYNPFSSRSLDDDKAKKREPFTTEELMRIFGAAEYRSRRFDMAHHYWLPIMGLLTGARLTELCQLYLSDFEDIDGIPCISIQDEQEGQRLKNKNARRYVPIHDKLIEIGLLDYVEKLRNQGSERLFHTLKRGKHSFGDLPSKWFGHFKERCGILEKRTKVFHSFRHTFISVLLNDDVPETAIAPIVGHEGKLVTSQVYWNDKAPAKRKPTVERFQPPLEVWRLIPKFEDVEITGEMKEN